MYPPAAALNSSVFLVTVSNHFPKFLQAESGSSVFCARSYEPNPSMTVCPANRQRAKVFVEYRSTRRKKKNFERTKRGTGQNGRRAEGKRRQKNNAQRNGNCDGRMGTSGEERTTKQGKRYSGTETSGGRHATKRGNGAGGAEALGG